MPTGEALANCAIYWPRPLGNTEGARHWDNEQNPLRL
jgi:hypothetical protein